MMTYEELKKNKSIRSYIIKADESLLALGFTEHSFAHVCKVAEEASRMLRTLDYDAHTCELAKVAGYLHEASIRKAARSWLFAYSITSVLRLTILQL